MVISALCLKLLKARNILKQNLRKIILVIIGNYFSFFLFKNKHKKKHSETPVKSRKLGRLQISYKLIVIVTPGTSFI